jgi:peptide/nickel transport system substrate-binding protein
MSRPALRLRQGGRQVLLLLILMLLGGCVAGGQAAAPTAVVATPTAAPALERGTEAPLRLLYWQAPTMFNPHLTSALPDWEISRLSYEPLASFDKDGNLIPILAAEVPSLQNGEVAPDGRSVTWKLKQGVLWSDGLPFTAADVKFTYQFIVDPATASPSIGAYAAVSGVEVIDPYTVRVDFRLPNPAWARPFSGFQGLILPEHVFEAYMGAKARTAPADLAPVGTGPYIVQKYTPRAEVLLLGTSLVQTDQIVFEPNPHFREPGRPAFRLIEIEGGAVTSEAARMTLQSGDFDYAWDLQVTPASLQELGTYYAGKLSANLGPAVERIVLNRTDPRQRPGLGEAGGPGAPNPFFDDLRVRQAFAYAVDRQAIAALYPGSVPADNLLVSPPDYQSSQVSYIYDLRQAALLLDQAGWVLTGGVRQKDGVKLQVHFEAPADPTRQQIQKIIQASLASIGVQVTLSSVDPRVYFSIIPGLPQTLQQFQADMAEYSRGNDSADPGSYMGLWTCSQIPQAANRWSGGNIARWCNPAYDALYARSVTELDPQKRQQLMIQMNDMLVQDVVVIPLVQIAQVAGVSSSITGLDPTPWDGDLWNVQDWSRNLP